MPCKTVFRPRTLGRPQQGGLGHCHFISGGGMGHRGRLPCSTWTGEDRFLLVSFAYPSGEARGSRGGHFRQRKLPWLGVPIAA